MYVDIVISKVFNLTFFFTGVNNIKNILECLQRFLLYVAIRTKKGFKALTMLPRRIFLILHSVTVVGRWPGYTEY